MGITGEERMRRGLEVFNKMYPEGPVPEGQDRGGTPLEVASGLGELAIGAVYGELWTRPGLDLKGRSLVTMAAVTALGRMEELRIHVRGALNLGLSRQEIAEAIMHLCMYAGFPTAVEGLHVVASVFEEFDARAKG